MTTKESSEQFTAGEWKAFHRGESWRLDSKCYNPSEVQAAWYDKTGRPASERPTGIGQSRERALFTTWQSGRMP